jgi:hypothetical protein
MRSVIAAVSAAVLAMILFSPSAASAASPYVRITDPFTNVYERLDPKSTVIKLAKKGDRFDLIYAGPLWYQIKVQDQIGWVERKAGRVVEGTSLFTTIISIMLIFVLIAGTFYAVVSYIKKQKTA